MCDSLISYPTEEFSKLIFVTKILLHRPYEAFENSNTDIERLSSHLWKILTPYFVFLVEYRRELRFPREGVFEAARDENYFRPVAVLFRKKRKKQEMMGGRTSEMCIQVGRKWSVCICIQQTLPSHNINMINILCKQKVKCQRIRDFRKARETPSLLTANSWRAW